MIFLINVVEGLNEHLKYFSCGYTIPSRFAIFFFICISFSFRSAFISFYSLTLWIVTRLFSSFISLVSDNNLSYFIKKLRPYLRMAITFVCIANLVGCLWLLFGVLILILYDFYFKLHDNNCNLWTRIYSWTDVTICSKGWQLRYKTWTVLIGPCDFAGFVLSLIFLGSCVQNFKFF